MPCTTLFALFDCHIANDLRLNRIVAIPELFIQLSKFIDSYWAQNPGLIAKRSIGMPLRKLYEVGGVGAYDFESRYRTPLGHGCAIYACFWMLHTTAVSSGAPLVYTPPAMKDPALVRDLPTHEFSQRFRQSLTRGNDSCCLAMNNHDLKMVDDLLDQPLAAWIFFYPSSKQVSMHCRL